MSTFITKWVKTAINYSEIHIHRDGAQGLVNWDELENQALIQFIDGPTLSLKAIKGQAVIYTDEAAIKRDLTTHPCYKTGSYENLFRVWVRHSIGHRLHLSREQVEFVKDVLLELNELN